MVFGLVPSQKALGFVERHTAVLRYEHNPVAAHSSAVMAPQPYQDEAAF